jgi:hypothetical protein
VELVQGQLLTCLLATESMRREAVENGEVAAAVVTAGSLASRRDVRWRRFPSNAALAAKVLALKHDATGASIAAVAGEEAARRTRRNAAEACRRLARAEAGGAPHLADRHAAHVEAGSPAGTRCQRSPASHDCALASRSWGTVASGARPPEDCSVGRGSRGEAGRAATAKQGAQGSCILSAFIGSTTRVHMSTSFVGRGPCGSLSADPTGGCRTGTLPPPLSRVHPVGVGSYLRGGASRRSRRRTDPMA